MGDTNHESAVRAQVKFGSLGQQDVLALQNALLQLESDAESIADLHQLIGGRIKCGRQFLYQATAALAPINRLPAEVLARIFVAGKHMELNFSPRMSWVAQRWRNVALSTPELWNTIPLTGVARATVYLKRSGTTLLDIEADFRTYRISIFEIDQCMKNLEPHRFRWRNLKVLLEDHDQSQPILRQIEGICTDVQQQMYPSSLQSIYFGVASSHATVSSHYSSALNIPSIPSLGVVELLAVDLSCLSGYDPDGFRQLSRLSLSSIHNMHLEANLFNALFAMRNLSELILDQCDFVMPALVDDKSPINLEKLKSIQLSFIPDEVVNTILTRLHTPNLQHFELSLRELDGPSQVLNWEAIRSKYTGLSVLKLNTITSYATRFLIQWLAELPQLVVLSVVFYERLSPHNTERSSEQVLERLGELRNYCCPSLHRLEVGVLAQSGVAALRTMLGSRPRLLSGKVSIVLQLEPGENANRDENITWMQTHLNKFKIRAMFDEVDSEAMSDESDGEC